MHTPMPLNQKKLEVLKDNADYISEDPLIAFVQLWAEWSDANVDIIGHNLQNKAIRLEAVETILPMIYVLKSLYTVDDDTIYDYMRRILYRRARVISMHQINKLTYGMAHSDVSELLEKLAPHFIANADAAGDKPKQPEQQELIH